MPRTIVTRWKLLLVLLKFLLGAFHCVDYTSLEFERYLFNPKVGPVYQRLSAPPDFVYRQRSISNRQPVLSTQHSESKVADMFSTPFKENFNRKKLPQNRVELHIHLDGSYRPTTVWELAKEKGIDLKVNSVEELIETLASKKPVKTLTEILGRFKIFAPVFVGDAKALERAAYELCEDQAKEGVIYFETRYSPHLLSSTHGLPEGQRLSPTDNRAVTPTMVVESIAKGLKRGQKDFNIKARVILCCMRHISQWHEEVLQLCVKYKHSGVVGIDLAGDEGNSHLYSEHSDPETLMQEDIDIYKKAAKLKVHRTVHAGEVGPAENVRMAIEDMMAERVGHGYATVQDESLYRDAIRRGIHFETCPFSSMLTGGASPDKTDKHPIVRFAEDNASFSINKDDTLLTNTTLDDEYESLRKMGLTEVHFVRANFNAARASFLPAEEKEELLQKLREVYGV